MHSERPARVRRSFSASQIVLLVFCVGVLVSLAACGGSSATPGPPPPPPPPPNPVPEITSLSPNTMAVQNPPGPVHYGIEVSGTNISSSSYVLWNGRPVLGIATPPNGVATYMLEEPGGGDFGAPGTATITVFTPPPGGGTSNSLTFTIVPAPAITALSPSSALAGGPSFTLTVTGSSFYQGTTVYWGNNALPTTFISNTELQAVVDASNIATAGTAQVVVVDPPTLGPSTPQPSATFTINNPVPTVTALTPASAIAGGLGFTLTVTGTNFVPSSTVQWNGSARTTTFISSTSLLATIGAGDIATGGVAHVSVSSPGPGGGSSVPANFSVVGPTISLLNPSSAVKGGTPPNLTVTGTNFVPASVVQFNGTALTTAFVSSTELQAALTSVDISAVGAASIAVANPAANGGTSPAATFFIGSAGAGNFAVIPVSQASKDIVYDASNRLLYLSVTSTASSHPNTFAVLDPLKGVVASWQPTGVNPNVLALSDDGQFLYVGIDAAVQRFLLPSFASDINYPLPADSFGGGPFFALDLQVAPATPGTVAISLGVTTSTPAAQGGIVIYDDSVARPTTAPGLGPGGGGSALYDSLQWGSDATTFFAANNESSAFDFYTLSVNASGVTQTKDYPNAFSNFSNRIHFDAGTKLVYSDDGHVVDPATGKSTQAFPSPGFMVPDSTLNKAFFLTGSGSALTITSFDLTLFTQIDSISINNVTGKPQRLIRWGQNGLAFNTDGGHVFLIGGSIVH